MPAHVIRLNSWQLGAPAAHGARALGRRVGDEFVAPLCRIHHRALHRHEPRWWQEANRDPVVLAENLQERSGLIGGAPNQRGVARPSGNEQGIRPRTGICQPVTRSENSKQRAPRIEGGASVALSRQRIPTLHLLRSIRYRCGFGPLLAREFCLARGPSRAM
jgi:hypothetical protein